MGSTWIQAHNTVVVQNQIPYTLHVCSTKVNRWVKEIWSCIVEKEDWKVKPDGKKKWKCKAK